MAKNILNLWRNALDKVVEFEKSFLMHSIPATRYTPCKDFRAGRCYNGEYCLDSHKVNSEKLCDDIKNGGVCVRNDCHYHHAGAAESTMPAQGYAPAPANLLKILDKNQPGK